MGGEFIQPQFPDMTHVLVKSEQTLMYSINQWLQDTFKVPNLSQTLFPFGTEILAWAILGNM